MWEFGVLHESANTADVKPMLFDERESSHTLGFPVGYRDAKDYHAPLAPLWTDYLTWLGRHFGHAIYFFSDEIWQDGTGWLDFSDALSRGCWAEPSVLFEAL
jgi:hypothetical protein